MHLAVGFAVVFDADQKPAAHRFQPDTNAFPTRTDLIVVMHLVAVVCVSCQLPPYAA